VNSPHRHAASSAKGQCVEFGYSSVKKQAMPNIGAKLTVQFAFWFLNDWAVTYLMV
jgi:hypothetical protein